MSQIRFSRRGIPRISKLAGDESETYGDSIQIRPKQADGGFVCNYTHPKSDNSKKGSCLTVISRWMPLLACNSTYACISNPAGSHGLPESGPQEAVRAEWQDRLLSPVQPAVGLSDRGPPHQPPGRNQGSPQTRSGQFQRQVCVKVLFLCVCVCVCV